MRSFLQEDILSSPRPPPRLTLIAIIDANAIRAAADACVQPP